MRNGERAAFMPIKPRAAARGLRSARVAGVPRRARVPAGIATGAVERAVRQAHGLAAGIVARALETAHGLALAAERAAVAAARRTSACRKDAVVGTLVRAGQRRVRAHADPGRPRRRTGLAHRRAAGVL